MDYTDLPFGTEVTIPAGTANTTPSCVDVVTNDDNFLEFDEEFSVAINLLNSESSSVSNTVGTTVMILIMDNDGMGVSINNV